MPLIHQAKCSACDYVRGGTEGYTAIIVAEPSTHRCVHSEEPLLVVLAHPLESMILDDHGLTFQSAAWSGRKVGVACVICPDCGTNYELRRLTGAGACGCLTASFGCWILAMPLLLIAAWTGLFDIGPGYFALGLILALLIGVVDVVTDSYVRWRYRERAEKFDRGPGCPKCACKEYAHFRPRREPFPCPKCGHRTVLLKMFAIS
jgi:ssDNA-binding Zn-finger/Zn-ribbon topoisomerase 1